jgi:hypothetical protein
MLGLLLMNVSGENIIFIFFGHNKYSIHVTVMMMNFWLFHSAGLPRHRRNNDTERLWGEGAGLIEDRRRAGVIFEVF